MTIWDRRGQRITKSPAGQWGDPRVAVTCALIALFAYAYIGERRALTAKAKGLLA